MNMNVVQTIVAFLLLQNTSSQEFDCGTNIGCFRNPPGCAFEDCDFFVSWQPEDDVINFDVSVTVTNSNMRWAALGFSLDGFMEDDSVTDCIYDPDSNSVVIQQSWNLLYANEVLEDTQLGLSPEGQVGRLEDGRLECSYSRYIIPALFSPDSPELNRVVNLTDSFHILMAKGPLFDGLKVYHDARFASADTLLMTDVTSGDDGPAANTKRDKAPAKADASFKDEKISTSTGGCAVDIGCYRYPSECPPDQCEFFMTFKPEGDVVEFNISVSVTNDMRWAAVGFSTDDTMGADSVTDCIYNETSDTFTIQQSYNPSYSNDVLAESQLGLSPEGQYGRLVDGRLECHFFRYIYPSLISPNSSELHKVVNLTDPFYILMAKGKLESDGITKRQHDERQPSSNTLVMTDITSGDDGNVTTTPTTTASTTTASTTTLPPTEGCGADVGCYRYPSGCFPDECEFLMTFKPEGDVVEFNISVSVTNDNTRWAAVGFSTDDNMGTDSVTDCIYYETSDTFQIQQSYNPGYSNEVLTESQLGLSPEGQYGRLIDGRLECHFFRYIFPSLYSPNSSELHKVVNLTDPFYILMAKGKLESDGMTKHQHDERQPSPNTLVMIDVTSGDNGVEKVLPNGCGVERGCLLVPFGCEEQECDFFVSWIPHNDTISFNLSSAINYDDLEWTALAFSFDQAMAEDSVTDCIYNSSNGEVIVQQSYNLLLANEPLREDQLGLVENSTSGRMIDGRMECTFSRYIRPDEIYPNSSSTELQYVFSLDEPYYLFVAKGPLQNQNQTSLQGELLKSQHYPDTRRFSETRLNVTNIEDVGTTAEETVTLDPPPEECGTTKGCFGVPEGCGINSCKLFVSWMPDKDVVHFELSVSQEENNHRWAAIGFSTDELMGEDSVTDCIYDEENNTVFIQQSYNYNRDSNPNDVLQHPQLGLLPEGQEGSVANGRISCKFSRYIIPAEVSPDDPQIDLVYNLNESYYLLLAKGAVLVDDLAKDYHNEYKTISSQRINVSDPNFGRVTAGLPAERLVKAHGLMMTWAWVVFACIGVFMPRQFKGVTADIKSGGIALWFHVHRFCMVLVFAMNIVAVIVIIVDVKGYPNIIDMPGRAHPIVGFATLFCVVLNPLMAVFRPHPGTKYRPIFNWAHFLVGSAAHILAATTMLLATYLIRAAMVESSRWMITGVVVWHVLVELILIVHEECTKPEKESSKPLETYTSSSTNIIENGASYKINNGLSSGISIYIANSNGVITYDKNADDTQSVKSIKKPSSSRLVIKTAIIIIYIIGNIVIATLLSVDIVDNSTELET